MINMKEEDILLGIYLFPGLQADPKAIARVHVESVILEQKRILSARDLHKVEVAEEVVNHGLGFHQGETGTDAISRSGSKRDVGHGFDVSLVLVGESLRVEGFRVLVVAGVVVDAVDWEKNSLTIF